MHLRGLIRGTDEKQNLFSRHAEKKIEAPKPWNLHPISPAHSRGLQLQKTLIRRAVAWRWVGKVQHSQRSKQAPAAARKRGRKATDNVFTPLPNRTQHRDIFWLALPSGSEGK
jgi:hypothetical protein